MVCRCPSLVCNQRYATNYLQTLARNLVPSIFGYVILLNSLGGDNGGGAATLVQVSLDLEPMTSILDLDFSFGEYPWEGANPTCDTKHKDIDTYFAILLFERLFLKMEGKTWSHMACQICSLAKITVHFCYGPWWASIL